MRLTRLALLPGLLSACDGDVDPPPLPEVTDPLVYVDPRIGTGGNGFAHGSSFVGAAVPHGLVKLAPDTTGPFGTVSFLHFSGYWAGDDTIQGFSHLHLHGAGLSDLGTIAVMPTSAFDPARTGVVAYEARFDKATEQAAAGRYAVTLADGTEVELTATARGAHHRYQFGAGPAQLVIDLGKGLGGAVTDAELRLDPASRTLTGRVRHGGDMSDNYGGYEVWFAARTRQPWAAQQVWSGDAAAVDGVEAAGVGAGAALTLQPDDGVVELQLAVSLVSAEGAAAALDAELPGWDFEGTVAAAEQAWRARLSTVLVTGGTEAQRRTFYTGLYHAFLMPTLIGDVDGSYRLAGMEAPTVADGFAMMSDLSLWDTYRTVHPLYGWLAPDSARDSARSLVAFAEAQGGFPRWPLAIGETGTMLGAPADVVIADAALRGVPGVDAAEAWPRLRAAALDVAPPGGRGARGGSETYMALGYAPASQGRSVSLTTELAHDDAALAALATALGEPADAEALEARSRGWRALYDPQTGFLRARDPDTGFADAATFDPLEMSDEYAEANAWQSLWMAGAHDPEGMAEVHGGADAAVAKLVEFFEATEVDWETADPSAVNFPRPYYWHGNEPDLNAAPLLAQLGRPDLAQRWTRWILANLYTDGPEGLAGNDDGGTLSSWYVLTALGLYPVPGSDRWILLSPVFPSARVTVDGRTLVVVADGAGDDAVYVADVTLDGAPVPRPALTHAQLVEAGELRFTMSTTPTGWGRD